MVSLIGNTRRPDISFHRDGKIDITAYVSKLLGLEPNDVIDITTDGVEYFLYVKYKGNHLVGRHEGQCKATSSNKRYCNNLRAHSKRLCTHVLELNGGVDVARLPVGKIENRGGRLLLPIIIRNNIGK